MPTTAVPGYVCTLMNRRIHERRSMACALNNGQTRYSRSTSKINGPRTRVTRASRTHGSDSSVMPSGVDVWRRSLASLIGRGRGDVRLSLFPPHFVVFISFQVPTTCSRTIGTAVGRTECSLLWTTASMRACDVSCLVSHIVLGFRSFGLSYNPHSTYTKPAKATLVCSFRPRDIAHRTTAAAHPLP